MSCWNKEYNAIFIHIPKTAGHSIERSQPFAGGRAHRTIWQFEGWFKRKRLNFQGPYKFTFVRNPWDRFVSAFFHSACNLTSMPARNKDTFREFVLGADKHGLALEKMWPEPGNHYLHHHFLPQWFFLSKDKKSPFDYMDFIGRYENLHEDLASVAEAVGSRLEPLPHYNCGNRGLYQEYYDEQTKEIIRRLYRKDIELFDYEF